MPCIPCYKDWISCGIESLFVMGTLAANSAYTWHLENKGSKYSGAVVTDSEGQFSISVTDLPEGLLNPYAGIFTLQVTGDDVYQCNSSTWNDSAYCDPYDCITFEVVNGTAIKNFIGCPCELL